MKRFFCIMLFAVLAFSPASPLRGGHPCGNARSQASCGQDHRHCPAGSGGLLHAAFAAEAAVCVTKKGKKYHRAGCRTLKDADVQKLTRTEAENKGFTPCKICKP